MPKLTNIRGDPDISLISQDQSGSVRADRLIVNRQRVQMMIAQAAIPFQYRSRPNPFRIAASQANRRAYATLIVDGLGNICGCGAVVEDIFGASQSRLLGKRVSAFIAGLFREGSSPSYNARYLAHLCADSEWRQFEAKDVRGSEFAVEINISRRMADSREVFVLDLRRPSNATWPWFRE